MLHDIITKGSTDRSVALRIIDSTDGTPETGVVWNTSGIDLWYRREGEAKTVITEATLAALTTAHTDGGFLHIADGVYRLDLPDAAFATGANYVDFGGTVTGMVVIGGRVRLVNYSLEDAVRMGLTALPNAAADAAGGLPISDAGGLDLDTKLANTNEVTAARMAALTDWINGGRLDLILDIIAADVVNLDGAAMRGTDSAALASVCTEARLAELDAANLPTDVAARATPAQVNAEVVDVLRTDTIPDSYAADGAQPTVAQAALMILQLLTEKSISGTTLTVKKPDGITTAMTFTLNDATSPTSVTRAT